LDKLKRHVQELSERQDSLSESLTVIKLRNYISKDFVIRQKKFIEKFYRTFDNEANRYACTCVPGLFEELSVVCLRCKQKGAFVKQFLEKTRMKMMQHPTWKESPIEEIDYAIFSAERNLALELYDCAFSVCQNDIEFQQLLIDIPSLSLAQFGINSKYSSQEPWPLAQHGRSTSLLLELTYCNQELVNLNFYRAPQDKLTCFFDCWHLIFSKQGLRARLLEIVSDVFRLHKTAGRSWT
jgi:hypothetical protein